MSMQQPMTAPAAAGPGATGGGHHGWVVAAIVIGVLLLFFALAAAIVGLAVAASRPGAFAGRSGTVALIDVSGVIGEESSAGTPITSGSAGARALVSLLHHARQDSSIGAVVLRINSPGGGVVASAEIYDAVRSLNRVKPVVVYMGEEAASGGYYISSGARYIVANANTTTGSIGVILHLYYLQGLYSKIGVQEDVIKSGPHKDIGSRPLTDDERRILTRLIDDAFNQFIDVVATGRHLPPDQVRKLADGSVYSGVRAEQLGLVDETGYLADAERKAADFAGIQGTPRIEVLEQTPTLFGSVQQRLGFNPTQVQVTVPQLGPNQPGYLLQYLALPPGS